MGYYLRYFVADKQPVSIDTLHQALVEIDPVYSISSEGYILYANDLYGLAEINRPDDRLFDDELAEFKEALADVPNSKAKQKVLDVLDHTTAIVAVQVLWQDRTTEQTLSKLDPLMNWLFEHYTGILHADDEGYYADYGPLLPM